MGNLGDAFKKAGLISEQELERIERNKRARRDGGQGDRRGGGRRGGGGGSGRRDGNSSRGNRGGGRRDDRPRGGGGERGPIDGPEAVRLLKGQALGRAAAGQRPFHFETAEGELPFVMTNDETAKRIEKGEIGIAWFEGRGWLLPRDAALKLRTLEPDWLRTLMGASEEVLAEEAAAAEEGADSGNAESIESSTPEEAPAEEGSDADGSTRRPEA